MAATSTSVGPRQPATASWRSATLWISIALMAYLLLVACGATAVIIVNFSVHQEDPPAAAGGAAADADAPKGDAAENTTTIPEPDAIKTNPFYVGNTLKTREQILILLALCGGIAGSFIHAAQSLVSYLGNKSFKPSWAAWYFLRPWIGGTLGMAIYFTLQAGLVGGANALNTHGVVALGLMGGWFSKVTADKLQEVFETALRSDEDKKRADKLDPKQPTLLEILPHLVTTATTEITLVGQNFLEGATVEVGAKQFPAEFESDKKLRFALRHLGDRIAPNSKISLAVRNPEGTNPLSESLEIIVKDPTS